MCVCVCVCVCVCGCMPVYNVRTCVALHCSLYMVSTMCVCSVGVFGILHSKILQIDKCTCTTPYMAVCFVCSLLNDCTHIN